MQDTDRRVLIVVENLPVPLDRRVWLEATSMTATGYHVSVICPMGRGWDKEYEVIDGVHIYRHPELPEAHSGARAYALEYWTAIKAWFRLAKKVRAEQGFDIIHACNPPDLIFLLAWRYRLAGVRFLFDHHDVCPELFKAKFGRKGLFHRALLLCERLTFATATVSMATNESFRKIAINRGRMKPDDVFVVRSAPRIEKFLPGAGNADYRKGAQTVLGYVGVIGQQEGMDLLIAALDHLVNTIKRDSIHLVIVGFGPHVDVVKKDVEDRNLSSFVTFTGALYDDELLAALNVIDIGVAPDPWNEMNDISTMNKVMEYMCLGKPVVQFDLTEGRASAGDASLYAKNNDPAEFAACITTLMDDPALGRKLGEIGRARVLDTLSWEHSVPHLLNAVDRAFEKSGHKRTQPKTASDAPASASR
ncbi:glycosyltransferase family 4 protein [uncultured Tateyamaria sp.]|uniref:glycosyltransferase family 4 protein n=1 Tax=uncultured Tateyamaria sp. TaxID=455651 RepID=UPI002608BC69|nr:glycosyltransferase family 4 protein [uncultured Tateyamaria sp.]